MGIDGKSVWFYLYFSVMTNLGITRRKDYYTVQYYKGTKKTEPGSMFAGYRIFFLVRSFRDDSTKKKLRGDTGERIYYIGTIPSVFFH